ncbi:signal transduction histidine kinase [Pseudoduganella flava]|uniref:histidine kinase n=1 Tax=Pseudoduganella flava TaxID=871742 RepID=A0A562Q3E0_9BURK|nr:ATP-binding protein [Pseudoduganella flava]QGZ41312.1 HAMP domain-containing protein [Pseudoduganella flava]TWI51255.1 signal transduction histidine kinase [Pseudoduganella flava]
MKARSLNLRLILVVIGAIALCCTGMLVAVLSQFYEGRTADKNLALMATRLLSTLPADADRAGLREAGLQPRAAPSVAADALVFQIWVDGRLVAATPGAPDAPLVASFADGLASTVVLGKRWRAYSATDKTGRVTVQVGNAHAILDGYMRNSVRHGLILISVLVVIVSATIWLATRSVFRPVLALSAAMRHRSRFDLTPLPLDGLPRELHPFVASFNDLLRQLDEAVEDERRFIGDAAHELRTPLSAVQAQAEIALQAADPEDKQVALRKLLVVAGRSTRLSEQLLDLARINAGARAHQRAQVDLALLVEHVAQEFEVSASRSGRALYLDVHPCPICCDVDEIGILLRNLLHNALRYTPQGGSVLVRCRHAPAAKGAGIYLEVSDDGPGVPLAERDAIFERFYRAAGSTVRGSGIGLSLVASIARSHAATIEMDTGLDGRGLTVRVVFPGVAPAARRHALKKS